MNSTPPSAAHPVYLLLRCSNTLLREAARLLAPTGLTPAQFNILNLLAERPEGVRPSEIAADLVVDPSSATYLIRQMSAQGWLKRTEDPADGRAYRLVLSAAGRKRIAASRVNYLPALAAITGQFTSAELGAFRATLERLLATAPAIVDRRLASSRRLVRKA
jgi:DNA-binding MarR family transcriptional regulator